MLIFWLRIILKSPWEIILYGSTRTPSPERMSCKEEIHATLAYLPPCFPVGSNCNLLFAKRRNCEQDSMPQTMALKAFGERSSSSCLELKWQHWISTKENIKSVLRLGIDSCQLHWVNCFLAGSQQPQATPACYTVQCPSLLFHQPTSTLETEPKDLQKGCTHHHWPRWKRRMQGYY